MSEPWFTYHLEHGRRRLVPRNAKGWLSLAGYVTLVSVPGFTILPVIVERSLWLLLPYLTILGLLTWAWISWSIRKSNRIDSRMSASELAEFKEWKQRGRR